MKINEKKGKEFYSKKKSLRVKQDNSERERERDSLAKLTYRLVAKQKKQKGRKTNLETKTLPMPIRYLFVHS